MVSMSQPPAPHHYWWASIGASALRILRPLVKLSADESQAWDTVEAILDNL